MRSTPVVQRLRQKARPCPNWCPLAVRISSTRYAAGARSMTSFLSTGTTRHQILRTAIFVRLRLLTGAFLVRAF
jgi:hypothetical protein